MMMLLVFSAIYIGGDWVHEQIGGSKVLRQPWDFHWISSDDYDISVYDQYQTIPISRSNKILFLNIFQGIMSIRMIPNTLSFWAHTVFIWFMYILMFWVIQFSLPEAALLSPKLP